MENELLALLQKRKQNADKEATIAAIAGGIGSILGGGNGEIEASSSKLIQNRLDRGAAIDDQSMKYQMAGAMAKDKATKESKPPGFRPILKPVFNAKTGRTELSYFTGPGTEPEETGKVMGFAPKKFEDEEKRTTFYAPGAGLAGIRQYKPAMPEAESGITPYFKKRSDTISDKFIAETKGERATLKEAYTGFQLLKLNGTMPTKAALNSVVKLSESGKMTDEDRNFILGAVGHIAQLKEGIKEESTAEVVERKISEAKEIYDEIFKINNKYISASISERAGAFSRSDKELKYLTKKLGGSYGLRGLDKSVGKSSTHVRMSNGTEIFDVPLKDKSKAMKDGFKVVK